MKLKTLDLAMMAMFVSLMAIGSNIVSFVPFMTVANIPITLQTFFAILAGLILGSRLGALSMIVYMLVGLAGIPVFAKFSAGFATLLSPSFGFILSFVFTAFFVGKIVEIKDTLIMYIFASIVGVVINYFIGTNWMYGAYKLWLEAPEGFTYTLAWIWMALYIPKDLILAVLAGFLALRLNKSILSKGTFKSMRRRSA